jgi:hypothetical protein
MKTVKVSFTPGGRQFSYLMEDDTIKVGDEVSIIANGGGEKVLPVLEVLDGVGPYATKHATRYLPDADGDDAAAPTVGGDWIHEDDANPF